MITSQQFAKHEAALERARQEGIVLAGGNTDDSRGRFVEPTLLEAEPGYETSEYALTGAVFTTDESALEEADRVLRYTAGAHPFFPGNGHSAWA